MPEPDLSMKNILPEGQHERYIDKAYDETKLEDPYEGSSAPYGRMGYGFSTKKLSFACQGLKRELVRFFLLVGL